MSAWRLTKPEYTYALRNYPWESIEATDRYTVVFKLTEPRLDLAHTVFQEIGTWILPPEVIEQHGNYSDWRNVVGTGPFMLADFQPEVRKRWVRNPDYWGFDEKYPDNQLPYVDAAALPGLRPQGAGVPAGQPLGQGLERRVVHRG